MLKQLKKFFFEEDDSQDTENLVDEINKKEIVSEQKLGIKLVDPVVKPSTNSYSPIQQSLDLEPKPKPSTKNVEEVVKAEAIRTKLYTETDTKTDFKFPFLNETEVKPTPVVVTPQQQTNAPSNYSSIDIKTEVREKLNQKGPDTNVFRPTPVISPIHGIIQGDKSAIKGSTAMDRSNNDRLESLKFEEIRKKAFGAKNSKTSELKFVDEHVADDNGKLTFIFDEDMPSNKMSYDIFGKEDIVSEIIPLRDQSKTFGDAMDTFKTYGIEYDMEGHSSSLFDELESTDEATFLNLYQTEQKDK